MIEHFAAGEIAHHLHWGAGKVLEVKPKDGEQSVKIDFNGRVTNLMSSFLSHDAEGAKSAIDLGKSRLKEAPDKKSKPAPPFEFTLYSEIDPNISKEWTVEDWMGLGELVVPYGKPGCGKSVLMGDLACHVAAGEPWFGKQVRCSTVLYVAAERAQLVERRFAAFRKHHGVDDLPIGIIKGYFDLAKAKVDTDRIIETVRQLVARTRVEPAIVIIDTKRQVIGDENSDDVGHLVGNIARIQHETGAGVIVIDHSPFHSPTKPSGRGELIAAADATILVEQAGEVRTARIIKVNDGPDDLSLAFDLASVSLGTHSTTGKVTTAPVVQPADRPKTSSKGGDRLTPSEAIAFAALEEAISDAGEKIASSRAPSDTRGVSLELWREYAYKRGTSDGDNPEARKKAFLRARQNLLTKNRIGTWADRFWIIAQVPDISGLKGRSGTRDIAGTKTGQENEH